MSHLTLEELARLLDETPSAQEAAHLDACAVCSTELEQMRDDVQGLTMLPDVTPAPDSWDALERRLTEEGLIRRHRFAATTPRMLQMAAAVVLFLAGSLAGRMSSGTAAPGDVPMVAQQPADATTTQPAAATSDLPAGPAQDRTVLAVGEDVAVEPAPPEPAPRPQPQPRGNRNVTLASNGFNLGQQANTMEEAITVLRQAEELYLAALTRYAELASGAEPGDPVSRLAALQSIVMTTEAALNQTPLDPVINGYHLTALAQRDAALRQVAAETGAGLY